MDARIYLELIILRVLATQSLDGPYPIDRNPSGLLLPSSVINLKSPVLFHFRDAALKGVRTENRIIVPDVRHQEF